MAMREGVREMIQRTRDQTAAALAELRSEPDTHERRVRERELEGSLRALDRLLAKKDRGPTLPASDVPAGEINPDRLAS
jgi:hypothetical protein